mgnify:CR=1 FL=1
MKIGPVPDARPPSKAALAALFATEVEGAYGLGRPRRASGFRP